MFSVCRVVSCVVSFADYVAMFVPVQCDVLRVELDRFAELHHGFPEILLFKREASSLLETFHSLEVLSIYLSSVGYCCGGEGGVSVAGGGAAAAALLPVVSGRDARSFSSIRESITTYRSEVLRDISRYLSEICERLSTPGRWCGLGIPIGVWCVVVILLWHGLIWRIGIIGISFESIQSRFIQP